MAELCQHGLAEELVDQIGSHHAYKVGLFVLIGVLVPVVEEAFDQVAPVQALVELVNRDQGLLKYRIARFGKGFILKS